MPTPPDKPRRWFLRFSLRTLLIVMLVCGIVLVPFVVKLHRYRQQRAVIEELLAAGASITFADGSEKLSDDWWRHVVGQDLFNSVEAVDLALTDTKSVAPLAGLKGLQTLRLYHTPVSDLTPLAGLKELQELDLSYTQVSDLAPLAGLKELQELDLYNTQVSDLAPLAGLKELQTLNLIGTQVSDLAPLAGLKKLEALDLRSTSVSDLTPLIGMNKLTVYLIKPQQVKLPKELAGRVVVRE